MKDFETGNFFWIIWKGPKCNHMYPHKRKAEGDLLTCREGHVKMSRWEDLEDWSDAAADHQTPEELRTDPPLEPPDLGPVTPASGFRTPAL